MTQIILPTWLVLTALCLWGANVLLDIIKLFIPKKKIVMSYKEFQDYVTKVSLKEKLND